MIKKIILVLCSLLLLTGCTKTSTDINKYLNTGNMDEDAKVIMPALDQLPTYTELDFQYKREAHFIFESQTYVLVVTYDNDTYKVEKENLNSTYKFVKDLDDTSIDEPEFALSNFTFNMVMGVDEKYFGYPKTFGMVGTSEETSSIAYLYFYDTDLDVGKDSMVEFVNTYFDYDFK